MSQELINIVQNSMAYMAWIVMTMGFNTIYALHLKAY